MKLRPHHIYCYHFTNFTDISRGKQLSEAKERIRYLWSSQNTNEDQYIEVKEGADTLCEVCPHFDGKGCSNPKGGDEGVRKWDLRIIGELGINFGQKMKVSELNMLIKNKAPLNFCLTRCPYHKAEACDGGIKFTKQDDSKSFEV
jgi:hypothetical protein